MAHQKNTITINGKLYDAHTGALVSDVAPAKPAPHSKDAQHQPSQHLTAKTHSTLAAKKVHGATTRSQTLMRHLVKNPTHVAAKTTNVQHHLHHASGDITPAVQSRTERGIPASRLQRAKESSRSTLVSHFGGTASGIIKKAQPVSIKTEPKHTVQKVHTPKHIEQPHPKHDKDFLIDAALLKAISHEQPHAHLTKRHHRVAHRLGLHPRFVSISMSVLAFVVLGSFFAVQNSTNLAMKIASNRAGVTASLPGYNPGGYALNGAITYAPGSVRYDFRTADNRSFGVTQAATDWSSQSLEKMFVATSNKPFELFEQQGRIIYIYDQNNATWVDGGVWYTIEGRKNLNTDQLLKLAASF